MSDKGGRSCRVGLSGTRYKACWNSDFHYDFIIKLQSNSSWPAIPPVSSLQFTFITEPDGSTRYSMSSPKVGFVSLGCPKAPVDSERILTQLRTEGYAITPDYDNADVVVVKIGRASWRERVGQDV